jgi:hypothetical protein
LVNGFSRRRAVDLFDSHESQDVRGESAGKGIILAIAMWTPLCGARKRFIKQNQFTRKRRGTVKSFMKAIVFAGIGILASMAFAAGPHYPRPRQMTWDFLGVTGTPDECSNNAFVYGYRVFEARPAKDETGKVYYWNCYGGYTESRSTAQKGGRSE